MRTAWTSAERKIVASYRRGEWQSRGTGVRRSYVRLARRHLKEQRINIRLSAETLRKLRHDAMVEGLAYQTLIASVLHRYANGQLHDDRHIRQALKLIRSH